MQPGKPAILTPKAPVVTLTRLQSGVGALTIEAVFDASVGDLRIGASYQLRSGMSSTARPNSIRPVSLDPRGRLNIDLRQCRDIQRIAVYGFSESRSPLRWGGTLVATTFGNAKIEVALDRPPSSGVVVFMTLFNVRGEFVIRAEMEEIGGSVRDASNAYGYERITWRDDRNPVD